MSGRLRTDGPKKGWIGKYRKKGCPKKYKPGFTYCNNLKKDLEPRLQISWDWKGLRLGAHREEDASVLPCFGGFHKQEITDICHVVYIIEQDTPASSTRKSTRTTTARWPSRRTLCRRSVRPTSATRMKSAHILCNVLWWKQCYICNGEVARPMEQQQLPFGGLDRSFWAFS